MIKVKFIPKYFPIVLLPLYWVWFLLYYIFGSLIYLVMIIFSPFKTKDNIIDFYKKKASSLDRNLKEEKIKEEDKQEVDKQEEVKKDQEEEDELDIRF